MNEFKLLQDLTREQPDILSRISSRHLWNEWPEAEIDLLERHGLVIKRAQWSENMGYVEKATANWWLFDSALRMLGLIR